MDENTKSILNVVKGLRLNNSGNSEGWVKSKLEKISNKPVGNLDKEKLKSELKKHLISGEKSAGNNNAELVLYE